MSSKSNNIFDIQHLEKMKEVNIELKEMNNLKENEEDEPKQTSMNLMFSGNSKVISRAVWPQVLLATGSCIFMLSCSMSASYSSVLLPQLRSQNSSITIDDDTASWITSSYAIAGPIGCIIGGIFADIFGRKKLNISGSIGMIAGWIVILMAQDSVLLIVARIIEGFSKGALTPSFLVTLDESTDPKYRGLIICNSYSTFVFGLLIMAVLGTTVDWRTASIISLVLPVILLVECILIPETPTWLVRKHHIEKAHKGLRWYWGDHEVQAEEELQILIARFHPRRNHTQRKCQDRNFINKTMKIFRSWKIILSPHVLKPFIIIHIFSTIQVICGYHHFIYYSVEILSEVRKNSSQEDIDPDLCGVILSIVRLVFMVAAQIAVFHIGRRPIALISGIGSSVSALIVALLLYITWLKPLLQIDDWIVFGIIILFIGFYTFGFSFLPIIMIGETQPAEVRSLLSGYFLTTNDFIIGALIQNYYSMLNSIGIEGLFLMFGTSCLVCTIFVYFFLPETYGKSLLEIESYFRQRNIMWTTRRKHSNHVSNLRSEEP